MGRLEGKAAIVTGSGRGLGRAYALALAKEGAGVVVNDINESADRVAKEIQDLGSRAVSCIAPVGTKETADKLVEVADRAFSRLDILVNNAGILGMGMMVDMEEKTWDDVIQVHLKGTFFNCQAAARSMIARQIKGKIINITSGAGLFGVMSQSAYSAAKAGILGFTYAISRELALNSICVNAVSPRARTEMVESMPEGVKDTMMAKWAFESSIRKLGEPEDVAPVVVFLASDEASYISGQLIRATGSVGTL